MPNGMHPVDMIMQQISLHDEVKISVFENAMEGISVNDISKEQEAITLTCDNPELPLDGGNIAYGAAKKIMDISAESHKAEMKPGIIIDIKKNIPLAAGLAGGSSNAAAVILGLNSLLDLNFSLRELCDIGAELGSDVPFCILGQAAANKDLPEYIKNDDMAKTAARARGTGTSLEPCSPLRAKLILAKPSIGVSTGEVYKGIDRYFDEMRAQRQPILRPNNDLFQRALEKGDVEITSNMINLLENYTLKAYPEVAWLKESMTKKCSGANRVLMSGSGPTVYAIYIDNPMCEEDFNKLIKYLNEERPEDRYEVYMAESL